MSCDISLFCVLTPRLRDIEIPVQAYTHNPLLFHSVWGMQKHGAEFTLLKTNLVQRLSAPLFLRGP